MARLVRYNGTKALCHRAYGAPSRRRKHLSRPLERRSENNSNMVFTKSFKRRLEALENRTRHLRPNKGHLLSGIYSAGFGQAFNTNQRFAFERALIDKRKCPPGSLLRLRGCIDDASKKFTGKTWAALNALPESEMGTLPPLDPLFCRMFVTGRSLLPEPPE